MSDDTISADSNRRVYESLPVELTPLFRTSTPNESIRVFDEQMSFVLAESTLISGQGLISLDWLPRPAFRFQIKDPVSHPAEALRRQMEWKPPDKGTLVLASSNRMFPAWPVSLHAVESGAAVELSGLILGDDIPDAMPIKEALFHVPNFRSDLGTAIRYATGGARLARSELVAEGWRITLDTIDKADSGLTEELQSSGGYGITHVGRINRADGQNFTGRGCSDLLDELFFFLSFCRGLATGPILIELTGEDSKRRLCLRCPILHSWEKPWMWMHSTESGVLAGLFPGYYKRRRDPRWSDVTRIAIYWYLQANMRDSLAEGSIIFAQTALEMLGWTLLVEDLGNISREGYDRLPAGDKMRLLLTACGIPKSIPESLQKLSETAKSERWQDGAHAIAETRNGIIHAKSRKALDPAKPDVIVDTYRLCLWYLDLVLLWLFEYEGKYFNRTGASKWLRENTVPVPWAAAPPKADSHP